MSDDIVAELDAWLRTYMIEVGGERREPHPADGYRIRWVAVKRARDEIVGLRMKADLLENRDDILRAAVLEEAARACERMPGDDEAAYRFCAAAIRALKQ